ncbi:nitroreductase family protein [Chloroflexota bacterium]
MELFEAIKTRRSIRRYKPDPVDDDALQMVLEAARWAPSWANTQCCRFIVVGDSTLKARLAATLNEGNPATAAIENAPVVIIACAELGVSGYYHETPATDKGDWYMFDVALAMQNLALAAHAIGLGTVHVGLFNAREVAKILDVPEGLSVVEMTPLGHPEREGRVTPRKELSEIVYYDKYSH